MFAKSAVAVVSYPLDYKASKNQEYKSVIDKIVSSIKACEEDVTNQSRYLKQQQESKHKETDKTANGTGMTYGQAAQITQGRITIASQKITRLKMHLSNISEKNFKSLLPQIQSDFTTSTYIISTPSNKK